MSFFDEFKDIVPYFVQITVGANRQFMYNRENGSDSNYKGKMVAFYKKPETLQELQEHGFGEFMEYLPVEQVSLPIDIKVTSPEHIYIKVEETSKFTARSRTYHDIRIFDAKNNQVGYTSATITPAGDIADKYTSYESHDRRRDLSHTINRDYSNGIIDSREHFVFKEYNDNGSKSIEIAQKDGKVIGAAVKKNERDSKVNLKFPDIRKSPSCYSEKTISYVASCVTDETDMKKRGGSYIPWECSVLEDDLKSQYLLRDFKGQYIGNILKLAENGFEACIVTKHRKDNHDYKCYTLIDLTGTNISKGTGLDSYAGIGRDKAYLEKLKGADKTPTFITRIGEDGKEQLVLYLGDTAPAECPEYEQFVKDFIAPFAEIQPMQISKFLNKQSEQSR